MKTYTVKLTLRKGRKIIWRRKFTAKSRKKLVELAEEALKKFTRGNPAPGKHGESEQ